jgi:tRNA (guanine37-N1)-methyltransferase
MFFRIFSLHPKIFESFFAESLMARAVSKKVFEYEVINWREKYGFGNYKQVDDRPFGGGNGMVLKPEPIFEALQSFQAVSSLFNEQNEIKVHKRILPNNLNFFRNPTKKATISLTPRGFPLTQELLEWLVINLEEINFLCGRYEGFDARVSEMVDMEISLGNFVLNGGEVAAMTMIEGISRLLPNFLVKSESALHDSFSIELNIYREQNEFILGKKKLQQKPELMDKIITKKNLLIFDENKWLQEILPNIEHPQYTRSEVFAGFKIPEVLKTGDHKLIQKWRYGGWKILDSY